MEDGRLIGCTDEPFRRRRELEDEAVDAMIARTPLGRPGQPSDIAPVVAFLASDDAHWDTGELVGATGGLY